jgi:hypothetical protein
MRRKTRVGLFWLFSATIRSFGREEFRKGGEDPADRYSRGRRVAKVEVFNALGYDSFVR